MRKATSADGTYPVLYNATAIPVAVHTIARAGQMPMPGPLDLDRRRLRRWVDVRENDRMEGDDADEDRDDPERGEDGDLLNQRDRRDGDHEQADTVGDDARHRRLEKMRVRHHDGFVAIFQPVELFVVPIHRLDRVAQGAGGEKDRDDEHERIEVEAEKGRHPETPDARQNSGEDRDPYAGPGSKVGIEEERERKQRQSEDVQELGGVLEDGCIQPRKSGDVDRVVGVFLRRLQLHHPVVEVAEVERLLPEAGIDDGGGVVVGDEQPAHLRAGVDREAHPLGILLRLRHARIEHRPHLHRPLADDGAVHPGVGDGRDLIRHHPLGVDHVLGDAIELLQGLGVVDVAVLHFEDDVHYVRRAEHLPELVIELNVRVLLRVEIEEVGMEADLAEPEREDQRHRGDRQDAQAAVLEKEAEVRLNPSLRYHE